jgi:hypothetical protein
MKNTLLLGFMTQHSLAIQDHGHGTFVDKRDLHISSKSPTLDSNPAAAQQIGVSHVQGVCQFGFSGTRECWSPTFATVTQKSELADNECGTIHIQKRPIHLALIVRKDPQFGCLVRHPANLRFGVSMADSDEREQPLTDPTNDLVIHGDTGAGHAL